MHFFNEFFSYSALQNIPFWLDLLLQCIRTIKSEAKTNKIPDDIWKNNIKLHRQMEPLNLACLMIYISVKMIFSCSFSNFCCYQVVVQRTACVVFTLCLSAWHIRLYHVGSVIQTIVCIHQHFTSSFHMISVSQHFTISFKVSALTNTLQCPLHLLACKIKPGL